MTKCSVQSNPSAALTMCSAGARPFFAFYAVRFFSALRFYFYYFFTLGLPSERKSVY